VTSRSARPSRKPTKAALLPGLLIFTEGLATEPSYLTEWYRRRRDRVRVTISDFHGSPLQMVEEAVRFREADLKAERKGKGRSYDEIWCVFDVDEHPKIPEAKALATKNSISVAISNPCIELWFILHFQDQSTFIDRGAAQRLSAELLNAAGKRLSPTACVQLIDSYQVAAKRAKALSVLHKGNGSPIGENPSSDMWKIVNSICR
jgi:hypothetical protein